MEKPCSRRQLLKILLSGALICLGFKSRRGSATTKIEFPSPATPQPLAAKSKVVICQHQNLFNAQGLPEHLRLRRMLDESLRKLTGEADVNTAWRRFVSPQDKIGLKVNSMSYPPTSPLLAQAITDSLTASGLPPANITIWDQMWENLKRSGYLLNQSEVGVKCYGTNSLGKVLIKKFSFLQHDYTPVSYGAAKSKMSKIFSDSTAVINAPVLKDHYITGVTCCMKNLLGTVHNPADYHPNHGDPQLADLNLIPAVRQKIKLHIVDLTRPLYHGGPSGTPRHQWEYGGLMLGTDPATLDYLGWQIIEEKRAALGLKSLQEENRHPAYIQTAAGKGLGTTDPDKIEIIRLELS